MRVCKFVIYFVNNEERITQNVELHISNHVNFYHLDSSLVLKPG